MSVQVGEKSYSGGKSQVPSYRVFPVLKSDNSESVTFYRITKILIDLLGFRRNETNSEFGIFTSKHDPICESKILSYRFWAQGIGQTRDF